MKISFNPKKLENQNFFFEKLGNFWQKRKEYLSFDDFENLFLNTPHYCNQREDLDVSRIEEIYSSYQNVFLSNEFPVYKKSKLHYVLSFCKMNSKLEFYLDRGFLLQKAKKKLRERQSTVSLNDFTRRFGKEEGEKKFNNYIKKWKKSISKHDKGQLYKNWKNLPDHYLNKINPSTGNLFSIEEAREKIKQDLSKGFKKVWEEYRKGERPKSLVNTTLEYYKLKGMTSEEAQLALKERQATFTLEKCIQKYGFQDGIERFHRRNQKWQQTLKSKSDEEKKSIMLSKTRNLCRYSKESVDFFTSMLEDLETEFPKLLDTYDIFMGKNEMVLWNPVFKKPYFFDFSIPSIKLIIEYNGSVFHPDPRLLSNEDLQKWVCPFTKLNGEEKYKKDREKITFAESMGYTVIEVWDHEEFDSKKKNCINILKQKLTNE